MDQPRLEGNRVARERGSFGGGWGCRCTFTMLAGIRKITDKPIKWVVNTHFHADHHYGNSVFKSAGATIIAHSDTARIMQQVDRKEFARRQPFFKSRNYDPSEYNSRYPTSASI